MRLQYDSFSSGAVGELSPPSSGTRNVAITFLFARDSMKLDLALVDLRSTCIGLSEFLDRASLPYHNNANQDNPKHQ